MKQWLGIGNTDGSDPTVFTRHLGVDGLMIGYLAFTAALYGWHGWPEGTVGILLIHGLAIAGILGLRSFAHRRHHRWPILRFLHAWYPMMSLPFLYRELETLNRIVGGQFYDNLVEGWERAVFGRTPVLWLSEVLDARVVSEIMHTGYVSYYLIMPSLGLVLYLQRRYKTFHVYMFTLMSTYVFCYLWFIFFPVQGPHYTYPPIAPDLQRSPVYQFIQWLLDRGAARGTAFPSSHVAAAMVTVLGAWRWERRLFWVLLPLGLALTVGTVYGRFHYGVDTIAGLVIAVLFARLGPWVYDVMGGAGLGARS